MNFYQMYIGCHRSFLASVTAAMLTLTSIFGYAAWDGVEETTEKQQQISLLNFNSPAEIIGTNGFPDQVHTKNGNMYAIGWDDMGKTTKIQVKNVPHDWSLYDSLNLWIYADGAEGNQFQLIVDNGTDSKNVWNYFRSTQRVDWQGWKKLSIPLDKLTITKSPLWNKITAFELRASGWDMNPNGCTSGSLYIADAYIATGDGTSLSVLYEEETISEAKAAIGSGAVIYSGSPNVVFRDGEVKKLDDTDENICAYQKGSVVMVPLCFFKNYMGAEVEETEEQYRINLGETEISGRVNEAEYSVGNKKNAFTEAAQILGGKIYLPVAETVRALGWIVVEEGALVAVSPDESIKALEQHLGVNELTEVVAYLTAHTTLDVNTLTAEDCTAVKDRWRYEVVGSAADNDMSNPDIAAKIAAVNNDGNAAWKSMIKADGQTELFKGITTTASAHMTSTYQKLYQMTLAYGTFGTALYHIKSLNSRVKQKLSPSRI